MGHLSTIIDRVERMLIEDYNGDEKKASKNIGWRQEIGNLQTYQAYGDFTEEEAEKANYLFAKYKKYLNDEEIEDIADSIFEELRIGESIGKFPKGICKWCGSDNTTKAVKKDGKIRFACRNCGLITTTREYISKEYSSSHEDHGKSKIVTRVAIIFVIFIGIAAFMIYYYNQPKPPYTENNSSIAISSQLRYGNNAVENTNVVSPTMVYSINASNTTENTNAIPTPSRDQ